MDNYIQEGKRIKWTNDTNADVSAGDPVVVSNLIGVACVDIADGEAGAVAIEGVFELPKTAAAADKAIAQGAGVLFDISTGKFDLATATAAAGDISGACVAVEAAATLATTVKVKLNVGIGTVETGT